MRKKYYYTTGKNRLLERGKMLSFKLNAHSPVWALKLLIMSSSVPSLFHFSKHRDHSLESGNLDSISCDSTFISSLKGAVESHSPGG